MSKTTISRGSMGGKFQEPKNRSTKEPKSGLALNYRGLVVATLEGKGGEPEGEEGEGAAGDDGGAEEWVVAAEEIGAEGEDEAPGENDEHEPADGFRLRLLSKRL